MENLSYDQKVKSSVEQFGASVDSLANELSGAAISGIKETLQQAQETVALFRDTVAHARNTVAQAKSTIENVRGSAKQMFQYVKENPEPFISATVPGLIGAYLLFQKARGFSTSRGH